MPTNSKGDGHFFEKIPVLDSNRFHFKSHMSPKNGTGTEIGTGIFRQEDLPY